MLDTYTIQMKNVAVVKTCEDTSKSCLVNLANAGVKEAIEINKYLGFTLKSGGRNVAMASAVFQEIRYRFINYYIRKSGYRNILDVGCGYSPRTFKFVPEGYKYVGIELPEVVEGVTKAQQQFLDEASFNNVRYESVKLTDVEGIERAAEGFTGPVCIVVEGVFMYFTAEELDKTLTAFRNILKEKGGCILTADYMTNMMMKVAFTSYAGPILGNIMVKAAHSVVKSYTQRTDDPYMDPLKQFADDSDEYAEVFFKERGFKVERVPLYVSDMEMTSLRAMDDKAKKALRGFGGLKGWIVELL